MTWTDLRLSFVILMTSSLMYVFILNIPCTSSFLSLLYFLLLLLSVSLLSPELSILVITSLQLFLKGQRERGGVCVCVGGGYRLIFSSMRLFVRKWQQVFFYSLLLLLYYYFAPSLSVYVLPVSSHLVSIKRATASHVTSPVLPFSASAIYQLTSLLDSPINPPPLSAGVLS